MAYIALEDVSLAYPVYGTEARSLKNSLVGLATGGRLGLNRGKVMVEALRHITLRLEKNDRLALIGSNGAGKSTLLKVLAKIYEPTSGKVEVQGEVNCLFNIMMGMDHELNGYENIYLRGLILGLSKTQIHKLVPAIEEFAELREFMKMPIKTYSDGMKVRLAFGIITHIDSEILLIDEIVGVGDANFIEKAKAKMQTFVSRSDLMVLSTHDAYIARQFCNKALWLEQGTIKCFGEIEEVLKMYRPSGSVKSL